MLVKEFLFHSTCQVRNGNFLKMRVSEICIKRICVKQGLGVCIGYKNQFHKNSPTPDFVNRTLVLDTHLHEKKLKKSYFRPSRK